ncbi:POTRA domain-containing protein [Sorangium cellulosum]|uniref:POTRA domain-containing protein n=1 Tax=Sorangium cellulosum TaxID=56 RepID=UPI001F29D20E|nr:POTRA domain-containing protein [Sorangium cellulosum]
MLLGFLPLGASAVAARADEPPAAQAPAAQAPAPADQAAADQAPAAQTPADQAPAAQPAAGQAAANQAAAGPAADDVGTEATDVPSLREPIALGALVGKPIVLIDIRALGDRWAVPPQVLSVEIGEPLSHEAARRAMREVLASGNFARASAEAYLRPDGVVLRLLVVPRRHIATIQISGGALDRQDTLEAAGISEGGETTAAELSEVGARVRAFYAQHGYPAAQAAVHTVELDDPSDIVVALDITAGPARTVSQRVFVVDPRADRELGSLKQQYRLDVGARVDEPALADADREMADLLRQNGFHDATVSHRVLAVGPNNYLYVYLEPGARIVPAFDGNRAYDDDALAAALDLGETGETSPGELTDRLRAFYIARGFLDAEITPSLGGKPEDPVRHLTFTIREHAQVRVTKRVFPCLTGELSPDDLGREIESFLEEDLPGADGFSIPDPRIVSDLFGPTRGAGGRAQTVELIPAMTYAREPYERALKHVRDLYFSKGYLNAVVGPVTVMRATCSRRSPPGQCIPEPVAERVTAQCNTDALGLPIPEPPVPDALTCRPDAARHLSCASEVTLRIPVHPGPQTVLYDLAFEGNKGFCGQPGLGARDARFCAEDRPFSERWLGAIADLKVGEPLSTLDLDAARLRVLDAYRDLGYAFAEVRTAIEPSPDRTRARARFIISERDRVTVTGIVVKGALRTDESLILRRVALREGAPFRQAQARLSEERIATLGPFSSVSISLEDPEVPQKNKRVIVTVVEQLPQYLNPQIGFSTGEGVRFAFEYGHRNIGGLAIGLTMRVQLSYLFPFLILDETARRNYEAEELPTIKRLERRNTISVTLPDVGLGPLVSVSLAGVDMRDNQREFGLEREALIPAITYRPLRPLTTQLSVSTELNDVEFFIDGDKQSVLDELRIPDGRTIALAERLDASWDARNNPFAATDGFLVSAGVEHVDAYPLGRETEANQQGGDMGTAPQSNDDQSFRESHFLRLTGRVAGYIPLAERSSLSLALSLSGGYILPLDPESGTYPDRLFFLGGVDSLRSHLADSLVPLDACDVEDEEECNTRDLPSGGKFMVNPRAELRIPLNALFQLGLFLDAGNLWNDAKKVNPLKLRYALGAGLRVNTPIGPLALDYGFNLFPRVGEDTGALHFSVGLF